MRRFTVLSGLTVLLLGLTGAAAAATAPASADVCTGVVQITDLAFDPPTSAAGHSSTATMTAQNCTTQPVPATTTWLGRFVGAAGVPAGCPVLDPIGRPTSFPAAGRITQSTTYLVLGSCTASALQLTVRITGAGGAVLAERTATLPLRPTPTCAVTYEVPSQWPGTFFAMVTVANTGATPVDGWTLTFDFPDGQLLVSIFSAIGGQSGATVTATNVSYNGTIQPGSRVQFGFYGNWRSRNTAPTTFTLNGSTCATG